MVAVPGHDRCSHPDAGPRIRRVIVDGLALGVYLSNPIEAPVLQPAEPSIPQNASVTNLRIIESDRDTGDVELAGDMVQPMRLSGNLQDQAVRQILVEALRSPSNPGVRLGAVELLSGNPRDPNIKEALMGTLINDENPAFDWAPCRRFSRSRRKTMYVRY